MELTDTLAERVVGRLKKYGYSTITVQDVKDVYDSKGVPESTISADYDAELEVAIEDELCELGIVK